MSPIDQSYVNEKIPLAAEILRAGGAVRMRVLGTSMLPTMWPGDVVRIEGLSAECAIPGEIVLYETKERFFLHRLIEKSEVRGLLHLVTRGDSMPQDDPKIAKSQLLGHVSSICRNGRTMTPALRLSPVMWAAGWTLCYSNTLRNLALRLHSRRQQGFSNSPEGLSLIANNNGA